MGLLKPVAPGGAYLKAALFGLAGSGKTMTATKIAIGAREFFGLQGPIAYFDTENGTPYISAMVESKTGVPLASVKSRSLDDLKTTVKECVDTGVSVLIVDSMTHVWEKLKQDYLLEMNVARRQSRLPSLEGLEFQHWAAIKSEALWGGWTNLLLNSPLHIIVCGRVGNIYEYEEDERGKRKLVTTGVKMKAEGDFGYEPSLVVEMEARQVMENGEVQRIDNYALVLKDRFTVLNGKTLGPAPTFESFLPHVALLRPHGAVPVDTDRATKCNVDVEGHGEWQRERRQREIVLEELGAALDMAGLGGTSAEAKSKRPALLQECFGTTSKTKLEQTNSAVLRDGLAKARTMLAAMAAPTGGTNAAENG